MKKYLRCHTEAFGLTKGALYQIRREDDEDYMIIDDIGIRSYYGIYSDDGDGYYGDYFTLELEPVESAKPLSAQPPLDQAAATISALTAKVQALETRLNALYDWHKRAAIDLRVAREDIVLIEEGVSGDIKSLESRVDTLEKANKAVKVAEGLADDAPPSFAKRCQTLQEIRDEIVERAKADVKALADEYDNYRVKSASRSYNYVCNAEFVVNRDKRRVTVILRGVHSGIVRAVGRAVCAPNDVFNAHIGRAIALRRALGLEVPAEYLNVSNPEEPRVGDVVEVVKTYNVGAIGVVKEIRPSGFIASDEGLTYISEGRERWGYIDTVKILEDSREEVGA